jgi:hypothetical protein
VVARARVLSEVSSNIAKSSTKGSNLAHVSRRRRRRHRFKALGPNIVAVVEESEREGVDDSGSRRWSVKTFVSF